MLEPAHEIVRDVQILTPVSNVKVIMQIIMVLVSAIKL